MSIRMYHTVYKPVTLRGQGYRKTSLLIGWAVRWLPIPVVAILSTVESGDDGQTWSLLRWCVQFLVFSPGCSPPTSPDR